MKHADGYTVSVKDDGPGITAELADKIFNPFYSTKEGGTGLGLSISKKIVERYGGTLTLSDAETGGACFTVFLPKRNSENDVKRQTESEFKNRKVSSKILKGIYKWIIYKKIPSFIKKRFLLQIPFFLLTMMKVYAGSPNTTCPRLVLI
jgi:hypothetical protein